MKLFLALAIIGIFMKTSSATVKAVLFDCDGTLIDSEYAHFKAWKQALGDFGGDIEVEEYPFYIGRAVERNAELLAERTGKDCAKELLKSKRSYYEKLCDEGLPPISGTVDFLRRVASTGVKVGVCSALNKKDILAHLKHLQVEDVVDLVLSGVEDLVGYKDPEGVNKPKPYIYLEAMKQLGCLPEETVVIEDSMPGVVAGVSAGCFTIAVPNGYTKNHDLSRADWKLDTFADMSVANFWEQIASIKKAKGKR